MMTTTRNSDAVRSSTRPVASTAMSGAVVGAIASVAMGMYAMTAAATYQHTGFFTPLYHIASSVASPSTLMASMQQAATGSTFYFAGGIALLGAMIHMMVGAMYGAAFAVGIRSLNLGQAALVGVGALWGAIVFAMSSWIGLPIAAKLFGSGDQITHMAKMVGYGTFFVEHVMFGLALGIVMALRQRVR